MRRLMAMRQRALSYQLDAWILYWLYVSSLVTIYDAAFVYFRPYTLPDGSWGKFFFPYEYYVEVDQRYKEVNDSLAFTVMLMNVVEALLEMLVIYLNHKESLHTKPLAFTVSVMTFWKTVLYIIMFYEPAGGQDFRKGNTLVQEICVMLIPTGIWVVLPLMCIASLWQDYLHDYSKKTY